VKPNIPSIDDVYQLWVDPDILYCRMNWCVGVWATNVDGSKLTCTDVVSAPVISTGDSVSAIALPPVVLSGNLT